MKFQSTQSTCGAAAIANALAALRRPVSEAEVIQASGLRDITQGMGPKDLKRALAKLGVGHTDLRHTSEPHGWLFLLDHLRQGEPVILAVDQDEHWVAAFGLLAGTVLVADGAHNDLVLAYDRSSLMARWGSGDRRKTYWGLAVVTGGKP